MYSEEEEVMKRLQTHFVLQLRIWLLRATADCLMRLSHRRGVRPSVCPSASLSVTLRYYVKATQTGII